MTQNPSYAPYVTIAKAAELTGLSNPTNWDAQGNVGAVSD